MLDYAFEEEDGEALEANAKVEVHSSMSDEDSIPVCIGIDQESWVDRALAAKAINGNIVADGVMINCDSTNYIDEMVGLET